MPAGKHCSVTQLLSTFLVYLVNKDTCENWKVIRTKYNWATLVEDSIFFISSLPYAGTARRDRRSLFMLIFPRISKKKKKRGITVSMLWIDCMLGVKWEKNRGRNEKLGHMNLMAEVSFSYHTLYNFYILNAYFYICSFSLLNIRWKIWLNVFLSELNPLEVLEVYILLVIMVLRSRNFVFRIELSKPLITPHL